MDQRDFTRINKKSKPMDKQDLKIFGLIFIFLNFHNVGVCLLINQKELIPDFCFASCLFFLALMFGFIFVNRKN